MKILSLKILIAGAVLLLPACTTDTVTTYDETPYEKRTAGQGEVVIDIDPLLQCQKDCDAWKNRALEAEAKAQRLQEQFRNNLRK